MVRVALLSLLLLLGSSTSAQRVEEVRLATPLEVVCSIVAVDCTGWDEPIVVISHIVPSYYQGMYYRGEPYIFISPNALNRDATIVHETTHYVLDKLFPGIGKCDSEEYARRVTAIYVGEEYNEDWRKQYGCSNKNVLVPPILM